MSLAANDSNSNHLIQCELGIAKQTSGTTSENNNLNINFNRTVSFDSFAQDQDAQLVNNSTGTNESSSSPGNGRATFGVSPITKLKLNKQQSFTSSRQALLNRRSE
jgi:hypothetical protein